MVAAKNAVWEQAQRLGWDKDQLVAQYAQDNNGEAIDAASITDLRRYAKQLKSVGANGLPLNQDGSVSIRQSTEEQRVDAGMMSDQEKKDHKALAAEVTADEKTAERGVPADDPWANIPVAVPGEGAQ
jgi:hypothetical protein